MYRCGQDGQRWRKSATAYRKAASRAWWETYPCECESETGYDCGQHSDEAIKDRHRITARLARWLRWRDGRRAAMVMAAKETD